MQTGPYHGRSLQVFIYADAEPLEGRLHNRNIALQVVELCVGHVLHGARAIVDCRGQVIKLFAAAGEKSLRRFQVDFIKNLVENLCLLALGHARQRGVKIAEDLIERTHIAGRVIDFQTQGRHSIRGFIRRRGQSENNIS